MGCIYRIYCFANGKSYVGCTRQSFQARINRHFADLRQWRHPNSHLQKAYLKYPHYTFWAEVLEENVQIKKLGEREIYWIAHFDSYHNGFNQTPGGDKNSNLGKQITWNGIKYESIAAAARALGVDKMIISRRIANGTAWSGDINKRRHFKNVLWNGTKYETISAAARAEGIHPSTMWARIRKGYACDDDLNRKDR